MPFIQHRNCSTTVDKGGVLDDSLRPPAANILHFLSKNKYVVACRGALWPRLSLCPSNPEPLQEHQMQL